MSALLGYHATTLKEVIEYLIVSFIHADWGMLMSYVAIICMQHGKKIDMKKCQKISFITLQIELREDSVLCLSSKGKHFSVT